MAIRIEHCWLRRLGLAAVALLMLPAYGGEMEIYVTTGPDGVEIFSNLPRGPAGNSGIAASALTRGAMLLERMSRHIRPGKWRKFRNRSRRTMKLRWVNPLCPTIEFV
jgi:hypothetical protein